MKKKPPPLNFVRSFEAAARHLSFTKAATELGCTQAAISMHIRSLERLLGVTLFERFARSLALTEAGEAYLPTLRQALLMIDAATETVQVGARARTVHLTAPMSFAENWLSPRLAAFGAAHPDVQLVVHGTIWETQDADSDLMVIMRRNVEAPEAAQLLRRESLALLCAPQLGGALRTPKDIAAAPKVVVAGRQEYWTEYAAAHGLTNEDLRLSGCARVNASNIALEMASHGAGLVVLPSDLAEVYLQRGLLVEPFEERPASPWGYYLKTIPAAAPAPVRRLADFLLSDAHKQQA